MITLLGAFSVLLYLTDKNTQTLLSPLQKILAPDLTKQLSQKLVAPPKLDYTNKTSISTLSDRIRYLVYNPQSKHVYLSKGQTDYISPGSFTKLMTTQVALDIASSEDQELTATKTSVDKEPTILELKEGERLSLKDLIRASIATSANDAAATIAEGIANYYHQPTSFFVDQMNKKSSLLGMVHTSFVNPEGYDDNNQFTTLEDLFILVSNVQKNYPYILYSGNSDMEDIATSSAHGHYYLPNWNGLLGVYPTVNGLKIAYTEKAGYSTIVTAKRNEIPVVAIVQGADSIRERDLAAAALLDAAYIQEKLAPVKVTRYQVDKRYKQWNDLATKIKKELGIIP